MPNNGSTIFTLLSCQVDIEYEDPRLEDTFRYLAVRARQPFDIRKTLSYQVRGSGPYDILEEGDPLSPVGTRAEVLHIVYSRVYSRLLERFILSGWVALHAALATINNCRTLILGHMKNGKTTLATRLLYSGHAVEGDEMVLVRNGLVFALPRAFHFRPDIGRLVPEVAGFVKDLPRGFAGPAENFAFHPSEFGFDWAITVGPVDRVVWITGNHGGETSLEPRPGFATIQHILECSGGWGEARGDLVSAAARLAGVGGFELVMGNPYDAVGLLEAPL